jgi:hypothetical protein|tara:strand:+ start:196 stop:528 length:333 start_codon:yes stop_codon:yes gene_type:complete
MARSKQDVVQIDSGSTASAGSNTDGMLLAGIVLPSAMTGSTITIQFASSPGGWVDVKETDGSALSYTVSTGDLIRVDPSGFAFGSAGFLRVVSGSSEAASRKIILIYRES